VKRIRSLGGDRRARRREGAFVVEGIAPVWRAVEAGADVETLLAAPELVTGGAAERLLAEAEASGIPIARLSPELFERLSGKDGPAGVMAVIRGTVPEVRRLKPGDGGVAVGLHEIANPGNLGTIIRTADAAGAAPVVTVGASTDPHSPAAVKASMGSLFDVPVGHATSLDDFFDWAAQHRMRVVTTSARAAASVWEVDWTAPVALLLGSEGAGLAPDVIARGDLQVRIPMVGRATSLNLAVAAGVLLFEARRPALHS
jgi:TrmH family RNA methyltransferase